MINPEFYNTLRKKIEPLNPRDPGKVRIYHCGPTVYKRQHIGNMRRFLFADFLRRSLELLGYEVREITNITDVGHLTQDDLDQGEDKIEQEAKRQKITPQDIADQQIKLFEQDIKELNIQPSHKYPRASAHIEQMQTMIQKLLQRGHAYQTPSGVYFDVASFSNYGKLSGNTLESLSIGHRVEIRRDKKNPADFALWVIDKTHIQKWDSPWGVGYPGWHIECSAMSTEYLGSDIDIHTGGEDNIFPHHENEIAQSEGALDEPFVRMWMHNRHLQINGQKLAKSGGKQITLSTIKEKGFTPLALRFLIFASHYRTKTDFFWESLDEAQKNLDTFKHLLIRLSEKDNFFTTREQPDKEVLHDCAEALADDLNTPQALAVFMKYVKKVNVKMPTNALATLKELDKVLGILEPLAKELSSEEIPTEVIKLADQREKARLDKKFEDADHLRIQLEEKGYRVEDTNSGPRIVKL